MAKERVLFICTHNSCRSQMAEGLLRALYGARYEVYSAGTEVSRVNPYSIKVMAEAGVDISRARSKSLEEFRGQNFHYVITVCDNAKEACPVFPGGCKRIHWAFEDPSRLEGGEEEKLILFRKVRDLIKKRIVDFFG